jgi:hypothetical protein
VVDKDVTYEQVLTKKEEEEVYGPNNYTGWTEEGSYIPTKRLKILPLIKKNFQFLYHTTQSGAPFGWNTFLWEVINSLSMATILCLVGYNVYAGTVCMHHQGYTSDFWMASFGIYSALVFAITAVVIVRTFQITWVYIILFIILLSLAPFFFLSYMFDTILITTPNFKEYVMVNLSETYVYYLYFILFTGLAIVIETGALFFRYYYKPTLADYFKWLIKNNKADSPEYFDEAILQNFKRLQDPIPKKVDIEWSDIISKSQMDEKAQEVEEENDDKKEDNQKPDDVKSLNSEDFTTNVQTNLTNTHDMGDFSRRTLLTFESPDGRPTELMTPTNKPQNIEFPVEVPKVEPQNIQFVKPRRISSHEFEVPDPDDIEEQM